MQKGLLYEKRFNLSSPALERELDNFAVELKQRQEKYGVKKFVMVTKQDSNMLHLAIIPCSGDSADQSAVQAQLDLLEKEGFQVTTQSSVSVSSIKSYEFLGPLSFDTEAKQNRSVYQALAGQFPSAKALHQRVKDVFERSLSKTQTKAFFQFFNADSLDEKSEVAPETQKQLADLLTELKITPEEWVAKLKPEWSTSELDLSLFKPLKGQFDSPKSLYQTFKSQFDYDLSKNQAKVLYQFFNTGKFSKNNQPTRGEIENLKKLLAAIDQEYLTQPEKLVHVLQSAS